MEFLRLLNPEALGQLDVVDTGGYRYCEVDTCN